MLDKRTRGMLYIGLGAVLFLLAVGGWLLRIGVAVVGLYLINYGLSMRGMPPLTFHIIRFFDSTRYR